MKYLHVRRKRRSFIPFFLKRTRYNRHKKVSVPLVLTGACAIILLGGTMIMESVIPKRPCVTIYPENEMIADEKIISEDESFTPETGVVHAYIPMPE